MHAVKHCGHGLPSLTRKNKDLHMCSSVWGRKGENLPLQIHAEGAPQREQMKGGSLLYLPDRPTSFFPSGLTGGPPLPDLGLGGLAAPPPPPSCLGATAQLSQSVAMATGSSTRLRGGEANWKVKSLNFPFQWRRGEEIGRYLPWPQELKGTGSWVLNPKLVLIPKTTGN